MGEEEEDFVGDTQILDQSDPVIPDSQSQSLARDQNSNSSKEKNLNKELKNSRATYWMNNFLKSLTKPKELDIEDPAFPFTSSSSASMKLKLKPNSVETLNEVLRGIS